MTEVLSVGYQGRSQSDILHIIQEYGLEQVLDVRENARSIKPGFSSAELQRAFHRIGVKYVHLPQLGCTQESRHALWSGTRPEAFLNKYRHLLSQRPEAVIDLLDRVRSGKTLLLCLERDPTRCHRAVLEEQLRTKGIPVRSL